MTNSLEIVRSADLLAQDAEGGGIDTDDLMEGLGELIEAIPGYDVAEEYYDGTRPEFFASHRMRQLLEQTGTTFRLNYAKTPVDTLVERLEINDIVGGKDKPRKMLQALWEINQMDIESMDIMRRACEFGDAYALVWPDDDIEEEFEEDPNDPDEEDDNTVELDSTGINIFYNDPRTMRAIYDAENPRKMKFVIKYWQHRKTKGKEVFRANLYYKDRFEKYITLAGKRVDDPQAWRRYIDTFDENNEQVWPLPNPFKRIPVFHFRTDRPYGVPEHKDAYGPQDAINKIVIAHLSNIDYNAAPQRYALSSDDLDDDDGDGEDFGAGDTFTTDDDELEQLAEAVGPDRTQVRGEPGHVWFMKNVRTVGQFDAAGPEPFMGPLAVYVRAMAQVTRTPVHRFDESGNPPSGESLKIREQPFVKKVKYRQMSFGATWADLLGFILIILKDPDYTVLNERLASVIPPTLPNEGPDSSNFNEGDLNNEEAAQPGRITVSWSNPAATDDQLTWDIVLLKRNAGVPVRQALLDAGYSKKQLDEWGVPASKWPAPSNTPAPVGKQAVAAGTPGAVQESDGTWVLPVQPPTHLPGVRTNPTQTAGKLD